MRAATDSSSLCLPSGAVRPDYGKNGLFGLAGSIRDFLDGKPWILPGTADGLSGQGAPQCLVFLLVDGLGDIFLQRHGAGSALLAHRMRRLTSVFPSTTACAVTTMLTGLAPAAHGLTGWFIHDRRFGGVLAPLPMKMRAGDEIQDDGSLPERLFPYDNLFMARYRPSVQVAPRHTAFSPFSRRHGRGAGMIPYNGLDDLVEAIETACASFGSNGGYVYAYYPFFDTCSHDYGCESEEAIDEFRHVDEAFQRLLERLDAHKVDIVVSADHGFVDSPGELHLDLNTMPEMLSLLTSPLFGERRAAFCRVRHGAETDFERLAGESLSGKGVCVRSSVLLEAGLFGPGPLHPSIHERIGDYALLMEPGWTVYDTLPGEHPPPMIGVHGGLTPQEMWVPLIHAHR